MAKTSKSGLRFDDFIEKVRPNPKSTDALVVLQGYLGQSDLSDHVRIYFNPELSDFIELPEREICYAEPVKSEEDALGGSRLWVRKTAVFTTGDPAHTNRAKSSFLEGDLLKAFGGPAADFRAGIGNNIPSAFLEQGCVPHTEPFGVCNVHTKQDWCQVFEPTTGTPTFQNPSCFQTCPQSPCTPPSGNPFVICRSVNNVTCANDVALGAQAANRILFFTSRVHPICLNPSAFVSCKIECTLPVLTRTCPRTSNCRVFATAACDAGGGIAADTVNYMGGFNPYGMGY
jgi:hypothetical protein